MLTKKITSGKKIKEQQNIGELFKSFARRKTLRFTKQVVKQKLHSQSEQFSHENILYIVILKIMVKRLFSNFNNLLLH